MNTVILYTLLSVTSFGIAIFLIYISWKSFSVTRNIKIWEIAQGTIIKSNVKPVGVAFILDIEYQYFVLGVDYKGISVTIPPEIIYDLKVAQGLIEQYPVGKKVDVFYNPENHKVAVLEKESLVSNLWISWILIGTALAFLIIGFGLLSPWL